MEFICTQCPRKCGARRDDTSGEGYCHAPALPRLARAALHHWEEPCISGTRGSGTIFFSGCSLGCLYCQNYALSHEGFGKTVPLDRLWEILAELEAAGAHNINLVNPTHYAHLLPEIRRHTTLPIVYNTGGYDSAETLRGIEGCVDIYLTDLKYRSPLLSAKYSDAPDYFDCAAGAIEEMFRQTGPAAYDGDGLLRRGVIVRHLVLPGYTADALRVLSWCRDHLPDGVHFIVTAAEDHVFAVLLPFPIEIVQSARAQRIWAEHTGGPLIELLFRFKPGDYQRLIALLVGHEQHRLPPLRTGRSRSSRHRSGR